MKRPNWLTVLIIVLIFVTTLLVFKFTTSLYELISVVMWKIVLPFLLAIINSYLLYPLLKVLTNTFNMHKTSAIVVIFIIFFSLLTISLYRGIPAAFTQLQELSEQLPQLLTLYEQAIYSIYDSTFFWPAPVQEQLNTLIINVELLVEQFIGRLMTRFINSFDHIVSYLMIPVLVFYFLKDDEKIKSYVGRLWPKKHQQIIGQLFVAIHEAFGTYIRGQMLLSLFIFSITFLLFQLINLKYALVLSLFMGVMNIIPYFGPIIGTVPAVVIALASSWQLVVYVLIIALFVQIIESALLSPYIMGKTAKLHPIAIIFILLVSSELGGIIAMIIAIPFVMIARAVLLNFRVAALRKKDTPSSV